MSHSFSVHGAVYGDMHLIGHSLGAHTAGYAGAFQAGFGRITGNHKISDYRPH